ncbi:MAG: metalloregulator ArsR/SmtB family transcription factor [Oscillospiraceae bacterium]|jgi:ArsR family transcriptional regulator|nr:metalloregulator ArsR/SmtB family transcription factor [Oscillospiraceae bacterium]
MSINSYESDKCGDLCLHEDAIASVRAQMPSDDRLLELSDLYKVISDSTRVKIIAALEISELCVCDIAAVIGLSQSAVSHQLRLLRGERVVKNRREGKTIFYSLADEHVISILRMSLTHIAEIS